MLPGKYDIVMFRGSTWSISVTRASALGVGVDFEADYIDTPSEDAGDCVMHIRPGWKIRPELTKLDPLLTLSIANSRIAVSGDTITLTLPASVTEDLAFNEGVYDIEISTGDAEPVVHKVLYGRITIKDEQTI